MTRRPIRKRAAIVVAVLVVAGAVTVGVSTASSETTEKPTKKQIAALFDGWNAALQTGDADTVADRYASDAVLLPTVSNKIRTDRAGIVDYFEHFLENEPVGKKTKTIVNVLDSDSAIDTGSYVFTLTDPETGEKREVNARYTYEYEKRNGAWKIVNHHSSAMPEG